MRRPPRDQLQALVRASDLERSAPAAPPNKASFSFERGEPTSAETAMHRLFHRVTKTPTSPIYWRLRLLAPVAKQTLKYGPTVSRVTGRTLGSLFKAAWDTCTATGCWPDEYYKFRLYRPDREMSSGRFVHERLGLFLMEKLKDPSEAAILDDKLQFATACARLGLPHAETIACFQAGGLHEIAPNFGGAQELPAADLFVKSTNLQCGRGIERWLYDPDSQRYLHEHLSLTASELVERVRMRSEHGIDVPLGRRIRSKLPMLGNKEDAEEQEPRPFLIQPALKNHPAMKRFTNGALCTVRVATARALGGQPEVISAVLRMPTGTSAVDNFAAGGLASPIDLESGVVGLGVYKDPRKPDVSVHPDSGEQITGEIIPFWQEILALCRRAHEAFPKSPTVGWDVAITDHGLKLIEANTSWGVMIMQMAHGKALGATEWPRLMMSHAPRSGS